MEDKSIQEQITKILGSMIAEIALIASKAELLEWSGERQSTELTRAFEDTVQQLTNYMTQKIDKEVERYYND